MSRHTRTHLVVAVLLACGTFGARPRALTAQAAPPRTPGAHVRVTIPRTLELDSIRTLDVPGKHTHTADGVLLGALAGGIGGGLIGGALYHPCDGCFFDQGSGPYVAGGALLGILGGALIGGAIGSSIQTDVWAPIPKSDIRVAISARGVGLALDF